MVINSCRFNFSFSSKGFIRITSRIIVQIAVVKRNWCFVCFICAFLFKMSKWENNDEIQILREYLRIPSVYPNIDYGKALEWFENLLEIMKF